MPPSGARSRERSAIGEEPLPLSPAILSQMMTARVTGNTRQYDVTAELELDPSLPVAAVRRAVADLLAIQPALRLGLYDAPFPHGALVEPPRPNLVPLIESANGIDGALDAARRIIGEPGFNLARPPLIRFMQVVGSGRAVLLICAHQSVFDGMSLTCVVSDLDMLLRRRPDVPALRRERERALREELEAQVSAACEPGVAEAAIRRARRLRATDDRALYPRPGRPVDTDFTGSRHEIRLDASTSRIVDTTCRALGVRPFTFFSAVFGAVVARHTGASSAVLGTPVPARRSIGSFALCGMFTNTLPLVLDIPWDAPFSGVVTGPVEQETGAARRDAAVPWSTIVTAYRPSRASNRTAGFSAMIALPDAVDLQPDGPVRAVRELGNGTAKVDLWLGVTRASGQWLLEVETDSTLLPAPVTAAVLASIRTAVERAAAAPETRLRDLFADAEAPGADLGVQVVDVTGHLAPVGVVGELPGGDQVLWDAEGNLIRLGRGERPAADIDQAVADRPARTEPPAPLTDPTLRRLERLWGESLGRAHIDPDVSLFDLGAHSLMALTVTATVEQEYGVRVPMLEFCRTPTLRGLAALLDLS